MAAAAGAGFHRADLHIHSYGEDGSYDVRDELMTPTNIVETARREQLSVIAVTDHNAVGNVRAAVRAAEGTGVLVVPGVELSTPQGHLLVYCATARDLEAFFGQLTISPDRKTCAQTIPQCLDLAARHGGFGVAAHIDLESGFELMHPRYDPFKEQILLSPHLLGLEVVKAASESWYTDRDESQDRRRLAALRRGRLAEDDGYELAKLMGSDAHTLDRLGKNASGAKKLTRLKLDAPCFDAVKHALRDASARVRIEDLVPATVPHFAGIAFEGKFLRNQVVRFSPNLTCVIGGRGAGKSTLLESLRVGSGNAARPGAADSDVWPDRIVLVYADEAGRRHTLIRDRGGQVHNVTDPEDGPTHVPIESYGQGETAETIQHCGKDPGILLRFLDGFGEVGALRAEDDQIRQELLDNQQLVERLQLEVDAIPAVDRARRNAEAQLLTLKEKEASRVVELEERLAAERDFRLNLGRRLTKLTATIRQTLSDTADIDWVLRADGTGLVVGGEEFARVQGLVRDFAGQIRSAAAGLQGEAQKVTGSLQQQLRAWEQKEAETQATIEALRRDLEAKGVKLDMGFIRKVSRDTVEYGRRLDDLKGKQQLLLATLKARNELVARRRDVKGRVWTERQRLAVSLNANLKATISDYTVALKFHEGCHSKAFEELLKSAMGWRTAQVPKARLIAFQVSPLRLADAVRAGNKDVLRGIKGDDEKQFLSEVEVDAIHYTLVEPAHQYALQRCEFEDRPELRVTREVVENGAVTGHLTRDFAQLSLGQQQALLLSIMLFSKSRHPLVIDQPEDNLDSEFVYKTFVKTLRTVKERRQVIVVTHNANIAVLGDAELIVPLKSGHDFAVVTDRGSIDNPATKALACAILEGSEQAFKKRKQVYGH